MEHNATRKGRLPACVADKDLFSKLWSALSGEGEFIWNASIKAAGKQQVVHDWQHLVEMLAAALPIQELQITLEYPGKGTVSLVFRNIDPAGGSLIVAGLEESWVTHKFAAIDDVFASVKDNFSTNLYSRYGSFLIHSLLPLAVSFIIVVAAAAIIIPGEIRRSDMIWWITAGTVVATLKLGQLVSDRVVRYIIARYPYFRWRT